MSCYKLKAWLDQWQTDIASAAQKHKSSVIHTISLAELAGRLQKIREAVVNDDIEKAVFWTADFASKAHEWESLFQKPKLLQQARSSSARNAANAKNKIPLPTVEALKKDFQERLQKSGPDAKPTTIYKAMAKDYAGGENHWRRIRTQVEK